MRSRPIPALRSYLVGTHHQRERDALEARVRTALRIGSSELCEVSGQFFYPPGGCECPRQHRCGGGEPSPIADVAGRALPFASHTERHAALHGDGQATVTALVNRAGPINSGV